MRPQLFSGARGQIQFTDSSGKINTLAVITDVSVSEQAGLRPTFVLGDVNPRSIEPLSLDVTISCGRLVPVTAVDSSGKASAESQVTSFDYGFEELIQNFLSAEDLTIVLQDKNPAGGSPITIAAINNCRFAGKSSSTSSGDISSERYNFVGIYDSGYKGTTNTGDQIGYGFDN